MVKETHALKPRPDLLHSCVQEEGQTAQEQGSRALTMRAKGRHCESVNTRDGHEGQQPKCAHESDTCVINWQLCRSSQTLPLKVVFRTTQSSTPLVLTPTPTDRPPPPSRTTLTHTTPHNTHTTHTTHTRHTTTHNNTQQHTTTHTHNNTHNTYSTHTTQHTHTHTTQHNTTCWKCSVKISCLTTV